MEKSGNCFVFTLTELELAALHRLLEQRDWELSEAPGINFRARKGRTAVCAYRNGKLVAQGKEAAEFVEFLLEPEILREKMFDSPRYAAPEPPPEVFAPHAGIDESGKGDFFGPLVAAAVYVPDEPAAAALRQDGVRDSKLIKNDQTILALAARIRRLPGLRMAVTTIGPEAYNRIYHSFGSLNRLLAWAHASALEDLLDRAPECTRALADKFGDEQLILHALKEKGRRIHLEQRIKAESDIAVAAASIVARARFVQSLRTLGEPLKITLPKGAGAPVDEVAALLFQKGGTELLNKIAKMHFKNAYKARGLEPPDTGARYKRS